MLIEKGLSAKIRKHLGVKNIDDVQISLRKETNVSGIKDDVLSYIVKLRNRTE